MRKHGVTAFVIISIAFASLKGKEANADPLMLLPFKYGEWWYCTQGQGGSYSHQGKQYYAFDFNKGSWANNTSNPAYGRPLYSPVDGEVVEIRDGLPDFSNNSSSNANNHWGWGNTIVIRDEDGVYYVRLSHLKYGSTHHLNEGDWIEQGEYIGKVGQTGFSTSPHLHIQVMKTQMGSSKDFTFVEGKLYSYEWIRSSLSSKVSVIDNNEEISLSSDFVTAYTYDYGSWQIKTGADGYAGKNYSRHKVTGYSDNSYFKWRFRVTNSGYYAIYITCPVYSQNDPKAKYYLNGQYIKTIDQTKGNSFIKYLKFKYINSNKTYSIKLRGSTYNRYVVADAIFLKKF